MDTFHLGVPAGTFLGDAADFDRVEESVIYYIAARNLEAAQEVAVQFIGEYGSTSVSFQIDVVDVAKAIARNEEKYAGHKQRGVYSDEEKHLLKLFKAASFDLGSISIDRMVVVVSQEGKQLVGARIEASEGDRRRVIYLDDQRDAFANLKAGTIIQAVEAKF